MTPYRWNDNRHLTTMSCRTLGPVAPLVRLAAHIGLSVSNSLSGRHWELDQVPAVGDPTHIVQIGTGHRVSTGEGQRRVALQ